MKLSKNHVIGLSQLFRDGVSSYGLLCSSLQGGYVLVIPMDDLHMILEADSHLEQQFKSHALKEHAKIIAQVQNLQSAKFNKFEKSAE